MKNLLKIASIIGLTVITQTAYSGEVTATFTTGDILTAEKLKNIKSAVNDNDTRISDIVLTPGPAGADSTVAGPAGPAGLGAVVFSSAPTVNDDMNNPYSVGTVWVDTSTNRLYILEDNTANAAVWILAATPAVKYALGDIGPAGGSVFYVTEDGLHGLEAAPTDQSTNIRWNKSNGSSNDTSATGDGVGAGAMNTIFIIVTEGANSADYAAGIAANLVISYSGVDYGDWYLPSKFELNLMWINLADPADDGRASGSDSDSVGGFTNDGYWSSTQSSNFTAWLQYFDDGDPFDDANKSNQLSVRAVRAF
jgi:hypothetical protein